MSKRDAYIDKAQARLDVLSAQLSEQRAKLKGRVADQKIKAHEQVERLEGKMKSARASLSELKEASEDKWDDISNRFEVLSRELGTSVKTFFSSKNKG